MNKKHKRGITGLERRHIRTCQLMLMPAFMLCFIFVIVPLIDVVRYSFTDWDGIQSTMKNIGFDNYRNLPHMEGFKDMLVATFTFATGMTFITVIVTFMTALALDKKGKGRMPRNIVRTLWFIPSLLSGTVVGILWHIMYNYHNGVVNTVIKTLGGRPVNWLETYGVTNIAIIIAAAWVQTGMCTIIFMAGLQSIPSDIYEAAIIDGASERQRIYNITIPLMAPSITINVITTTIGAFKAYELPYFISKGMPGYTSLLITGRISFYAFKAGKYGFGSALAVVLILIITIFSLIELLILRKREDIYG